MLDGPLTGVVRSPEIDVANYGSGRRSSEPVSVALATQGGDLDQYRLELGDPRVSRSTPARSTSGSASGASVIKPATTPYGQLARAASPSTKPTTSTTDMHRSSQLLHSRDEGKDDAAVDGPAADQWSRE